MINPVGVENDSATLQINVFDAPPTLDQALSQDLHSRNANDQIQQGLIQFLERPVLIDTIQWGTSSARGACLYTFDPLRSLFGVDSNLVGPLTSKLEGFRYFKTAHRIRFQVTGNAFLSGKLRAVWIPKNRVGMYASGNCTPTTVTGVTQGVDIYPTENATYELDIPLLLQNQWMDVQDFAFPWDSGQPTILTNGLVSIFVLSPLVSEDVSDKCSISIIAMNKDFHLSTVYDDSEFVVPQGLPPNIEDLLWFSDGLNCNVSDVVSFGYGASSMFHNSATLVGSSTDESQQVVESGRLSSYTATISKLAAAVTPFVPSFAPLTMAVATAASGLSSVFKFFKLDNPTLEQLPIQMQSRWKDLTHSDGGNTSSRLSLLSSNNLCPVGFTQPFSADELSISRLCAIPQLVFSRTVDTTHTSGHVLYNWTVCPSNVAIMADPTLGQQYKLFQTNAAFIAAAHQYWRGDCVFTIEAVAQGFSKMTLAVTWFPRTWAYSSNPPYSTAPTPLELFDLTAKYTKYINVSGNTKATFKVPFMNKNYACNTNYVVSRHTEDPAVSQDIFTNGYISVAVVNPLTNFSPTSPDNNNIDVLLYQHWENVSFYRPCSYKMSNLQGAEYPRVLDFADTLPQYDDLPSDDETFDGSPNLSPLDDMADGSQMFHNSGGGDDFDCNNLNPSQFFGESSDTLLDLVRRPGYFGAIVPTVAHIVDAVYTLAFSFFRTPLRVSPSLSNERWNFPPTSPGGPQGETVNSPASFLSYFSTLFLTFRGEVTYTFLPNTFPTPDKPPDNNAVLLANCVVGNTGDNSYVGSTDIPTISRYGSAPAQYGGGAYYRPSNNPQNPPSVTIPYYTQNNFNFTPDIFASYASESVRYWSNNTDPGIQIMAAFTEDTDYDNYGVLVSAGDNFSLGGYYPCPAINYPITSKYVSGIAKSHA